MPRSLILYTLLLSITLSAQPPEKKHLLLLGGSIDYAHDSVSHAMYTIAKIGEESGLFDVRFHTDTEPLTKRKLGANKKNLDYFDAVFFYTQGDLPLEPEQKAALLSFVRDDGKGLLAAHSGTDSFRASWPEYVELVGGVFNAHPWHQKVRVNVEDRSFPATRHFGPTFEITDEIYQLSHYSREKVRVLMSLDVESVDLTLDSVERTDKDFALTWARTWGNGRAFVSVLGHRAEVWDRPDIQTMWREGIRWTLGLVQGDAAPRKEPSRARP